MFERRIKPRVEALAGRLDLPLRLCLWNGARIDFGPAPTVCFTLRRPRLLVMLCHGDIDGLGQAYVEGELMVEGRLRDILAIGIALAERLGRLAPLMRLSRLVPQRRRRHSRAADARWIGYHYDVSNDFYALWLDRRMVYSCAYFESGAEDIDSAQTQKLDHICRKLRLRPDERLLDVGCGWGGLLRFAARCHGVSGVGITLSAKQCELARRAVAEDGLSERIEIRLQDYRDLAGDEEFDKIVSVGMYEHVGHANMPLYFATLRRLLRTGGLLLNHGITTTDPAGKSKGPAGGSFIDRFVFPGGELPHIAQVMGEISRQELEILDVECLRPHYAATLLRWVRRLEARRAEAIALAGEERYRIWRIYMAGCALAFERNWLSIYQVLAGKTDAGGRLERPWTRRHQYQDDPTPLAGLLDWSGI
jgi:cyclopropane-fatty-acyl-phospholipid synthase